MKFKEELAKATNPWIKRIGEYLLSREDIQKNLKKENKSLKECFDYILVELSKQCTKDGSIGFVSGDDEVLFGLAVHYYDEDDIKVPKPNFKTNANGTATEEELLKKMGNKKAKTITQTTNNSKEFERYKKEIIEKNKEIEELKEKLETKSAPKVSKPKKSKPVMDDQISLF